MVRTRIAPSPTGFPHIGTVYQALFDYAFAKKHDGKFIVRIEDTDRTRFVEGAEEAILNTLDWFGLTEDESPRHEGQFGPYRQSDRLEIYKKYAEELVAKGHAYYCFCTKERLEELRNKQQAEKKPTKYDKHCLHNVKNADERIAAGEQYVIRLNVPEGIEIKCLDGSRGEIVFSSDTVDDQVLMKSDGFPTYHLAVVVDDHLMEISHVVRGEEWISSTPKHMLLYQFFGWEIPLFFHTALLRNPDKSKLSKRHGHTAVTWYQQEGYLPEAILNFLALMGWSHPEGKEVFDLAEFTRVVELKDIKAMGPVFDLTKLTWINGEYIRMMSHEELQKRLQGFYGDTYPEYILEKTVPIIQERIKTLKEYDDYCHFFLEAPSEYEKEITGDKELLGKVSNMLREVVDGDWKGEVLGEKLQKLAEQEGVSFSKFFMMMRIVLAGKKITPPLNESIEILGKEEVLGRIQKIIS